LLLPWQGKRRDVGQYPSRMANKCKGGAPHQVTYQPLHGLITHKFMIMFH